MVAKRVRRDERPKLINVKEKDGRVLTEKNAVCVTGIQYFEALFNVRENRSAEIATKRVNINEGPQKNLSELHTT